MTASLPRAPLAAALAALAVLAAAGCGKSDLVTNTATPASVTTVKAAPAPKASAVPVPLRMTPARSAAFARGVQLTAADLPGAHEAPRSQTPLAREREAAKCGGRSTPTVGSARSPEFERGRGLD